jgi:hypothetical protein
MRESNSAEQLSKKHNDTITDNQLFEYKLPYFVQNSNCRIASNPEGQRRGAAVVTWPCTAALAFYI